MLRWLLLNRVESNWSNRFQINLISFPSSFFLFLFKSCSSFLIFVVFFSLLVYQCCPWVASVSYSCSCLIKRFSSHGTRFFYRSSWSDQPFTAFNIFHSLIPTFLYSHSPCCCFSQVWKSLSVQVSSCLSFGLYLVMCFLLLCKCVFHRIWLSATFLTSFRLSRPVVCLFFQENLHG